MFKCSGYIYRNALLIKDEILAVSPFHVQVQPHVHEENKICHGQAAVVHTGRQHGCRETSHCQGAMLQTTSRCVSGFKGALSREKMYKTCAFKCNIIWGLTCLLYKQNQVFCLPAFFGFSDKVPLNQYWNFIIFRLGWLTATSESV